MSARNREKAYSIRIPYSNNLLVSSNQLRLLSIKSSLPLNTQNWTLVPTSLAEKTMNTEETNTKVIMDF